MSTKPSNLTFEVPTPAEDDAIDNGIAADADTYEVPSEQIATTHPLSEREACDPRSSTGAKPGG